MIFDDVEEEEGEERMRLLFRENYETTFPPLYELLLPCNSQTFFYAQIKVLYIYFIRQLIVKIICYIVSS